MLGGHPVHEGQVGVDVPLQHAHRQRVAGDGAREPLRDPLEVDRAVQHHPLDAPSQDAVPETGEES